MKGGWGGLRLGSADHKLIINFLVFCHSRKFLSPAGEKEICLESTITDYFMKKQIVNDKVIRSNGSQIFFLPSRDFGTPEKILG